MAKEYIPAYYETYVDSMLARGAEPGQGGHLEGSPAEVFRALFRLTNSCYSFLVTEIVNVLGMEEARALLKRAIWNLGRYSGDRTRREIEGRGLSLNVENLLKFSLGAFPEEMQEMQGNFIWSPHYVSYDEFFCPTWDQYKRLCPRELAILTCEDIHVAMAKAYNPDIDQWFSALLPKGEAKCGFKWVMSFEAAERAAENARRYRERAEQEGRTLEGERPQEPPDSAMVYRDLVGMWVYKYYFPIDELLKTVNEEQVDSIVRRAMRKWGSWRGTMMREDHKRRGWPLNIETFITYFDDPAAGDAWVAENVVLTATEHAKDVTESALSAVLEEVGAGRFAVPMFEEALPAQAEAYNPAIEVTIPKLMERGDSISRFCYKIGP